MIIRKATTKDFKELKKINKEFFLDEFRFDQSQDKDWVKRGLPADVSSSLRNKNRIFFIAEENGEIVGYSEGQIEKLPNFFKIKTQGHLRNVYVKKGFRKKGIAKKLTTETVKWFKKKGIKLVKLYVFPKNKTAYKIYKRWGFKEFIICLDKKL